MKPIIQLPLAPMKSAASLLALSLFALGLAGCEHMDTRSAPAVAGWLRAESVEERHPIVVSQQPHTLRLRVPSGSRGLTPAQRREVLAFANHAGLGNGTTARVVINAPGGSANEDAAREAVAQIREFLASYGTSDSAISVEAYHAAEQHDAPIKISVHTFTAEGPLCGQWPENLSNNPENITYYNFGCSQQKNLAAMVANPADLEGLRSMDPRPGERRDVQWNKYVKGETSNAQKGEDEKISVKNAVNN